MACKIRIKVKKKKYIRGDNTTMKYTSIIIPFVGGLGMFIYGMQIMAQGLENAAGNRMKSLLEALTKNKFFGVLLGAFITAVIQSSSATTVMVVGFVNASIITFSRRWELSWVRTSVQQLPDGWYPVWNGPNF